jgi:hypothetical protein
LPDAGDNEIHKCNKERVAGDDNCEIHDALLCGVESNVHHVMLPLCFGKAWAIAVEVNKF